VALKGRTTTTCARDWRASRGQGLPYVSVLRRQGPISVGGGRGESPIRRRLSLELRRGANYPEWLIREYVLQQEVPVFDAWRDGTAMVRYDAEIVFGAPDVA